MYSNSEITRLIPNCSLDLIKLPLKITWLGREFDPDRQHLQWEPKKVTRQIFFNVLLQKLLFFKNSTFSASVRRRANFHLNGYTDVSLRLSVTIDLCDQVLLNLVYQWSEISQILRGIFSHVRKKFEPDTSILNHLHLDIII